MIDRPEAAHPLLATTPSGKSQPASRREFLTGSTATLAGAAAVATVASGYIVPLVHAGGSSTIRVGLVGSGGRGSGAAEQALKADSVPSSSPLPMPSRTGSTNISQASRIRWVRVDVPKDRQYAGFDAYKYVIDQVDLVLLATPPQFRPLHLAYAVLKGVHAFVEKPMAVDGPGLGIFLEACKML